MATTSQKRQAMEALVERYAASQEDAEMDVVETFPAAAATDDKRARTVTPRKGPTCAFCAHPGATRRCGRCKAVNYCSPGCQREHWRAHKDTCAPHATFVPSAGKSLELQIAALYGEVDRCLGGAGLPAVAPAWTADRVEALADRFFLPLLRIAPPDLEDGTPTDGFGVGLRTLGLLVLRTGARPSAILVDAIAAHTFTEAQAEDPASYAVALARLGPNPFPAGHDLRGPRDDDGATLLELLRFRSGADRRWPAEDALGLGSLGEGTVELAESLLRQFAGVQEPCPCGAVDKFPLEAAVWR